MRARVLVFVLTALAAAAPVASQPALFQLTTRPCAVDSGHLDNPEATRRVVFRATIRAADAAWFRLFFADTHLPAGSGLRLTSALDGAVQHFDAASLRDYEYGSAYFNGTEVDLELIAGPRTRASRVRVTSIELSTGFADGPDTICGTRDDRVLSKDPRIARGIRGVSGCTWWLINEFTILTAGHCASGSGTWIVGFNLPLSSSGGSTRQPPPDDQYALDRATLRRLSSGTGADWAVVAAVRNSNHGAYPGQRQGWFAIGSIPPQISGVDIRITGNGSVSAPVSPTWNYVPKTHVGPRASTSVANAISYRTDTTGGNSGSPVILESTGEAIGIHTHGGCGTSGGENSGTRIDRQDLRDAILDVTASKIAGRFATFGQGCAGSAGTPALDLWGVPDIAGTAHVDLSTLPVQQSGVLALGSSKTSWLGAALPLDLSPSGLEGCTLWVSPDGLLGFETGAGATSIALLVPNVAALIGTTCYLQAFALDPGAPRAIGVVATRAGEMFIGG